MIGGDCGSRSHLPNLPRRYKMIGGKRVETSLLRSIMEYEREGEREGYEWLT
jgi:hypothetical protein